MKQARYVCTHCGKKFEAEEREVLECPSCFWSTSVKREDDLPAAARPSAQPKKTGHGKFPVGLAPVLLIAAVIGLAGLFVKLIGPSFENAFNKSRETTASPENNGEPAPVVASAQKDKGDKKKKPGKNEPAPTPAPLALTQEDQNILGRRTDVSADRPVSEAEEKVLQHKAAFKTGYVERLPSQAWTLEQYKKLIAEQERFYQVPLPGSYKKKLYQLFETKYLPAGEAFKNEQIVEARNLWVESLAFPVYAGSVQKHRGVVLTMLRSFINDTLAKIGAISTSIAQQKIRVKEAELTGMYAQLLTASENKKWEEAYSLVVSLQERIEEFSRPDRIVGELAAYPAAIAQVDDGIKPALYEFLNVPPPATADIEPIRSDVNEKRKVIQSFLPANLEPVKQAYQEALDAIARGDRKTAQAKLRGITFPLELAKDAQEKLQVLKKQDAAETGQA